jgi:hypothetical protein
MKPKVLVKINYSLNNKAHTLSKKLLVVTNESLGEHELQEIQTAPKTEVTDVKSATTVRTTKL